MHSRSEQLVSLLGVSELSKLDVYPEKNCGLDDTELFFPSESLPFVEREKRMEQARLLCKECVIRRECLQTALINGELVGIWGGFKMEDPKERQEAKRFLRKLG